MVKKHKRASSVVALLYRESPGKGTVDVAPGKLLSGRIAVGKGDFTGRTFRVASTGPCRIELAFADVKIGLGAGASLVSVAMRGNPFSFFLRDVRADWPIFIPRYGLAVTVAADGRSYEQIAQAAHQKGLQTTLERIESQPEESYESAAAATRNMTSPTWLGIARDMRIFQFGLRDASAGRTEERITPRFHGKETPLPENDNQPAHYKFMLGRGWGCREDITRRLEDGTLPILHGTFRDDDIDYDFTTFATLETDELKPGNVRGTHFLVSDAHGAGNMMTDRQRDEYESLLPAEMNQPQETVLMFRAKAINTSAAPRYAWLMALAPCGRSPWRLDARGHSVYTASSRVFGVQRLNGRPMPQKEVAILLGPGESATFEFILPHRPIDAKRAARLAKADFDRRLAQCRRYWRDKLSSGASISLPEPRIDEMAKAGLLHLDIVTYGLKQGPVTPNIGVYCPIGSESSPIIQFFDSMGWHKLAERALEYFLAKQHDDGFMQNFGGYMLETGAALWSMGEHYRYTRDLAWVRRIAPGVIKACDYMIAWRQKSMKPAFRNAGWGLQAGKVADPEDPFHSFMLNGFACLGIGRAAEMLAQVDRAGSRRLAAHAKAYKADVRKAYFQTMARSPVVPLGDGTWVPTVAPWTEDRGALCLFAKEAQWFTHGSFPARDSLIGPLWLIFQEVLDPEEFGAEAMLNWHAELACMRNVALSQPYYSRHPWVHLARGEVKSFLKAFYNGLAGLADRQTYSWWEHYFHASPHKTHEEAWHLMQTRWMLYLERGDTLRLLPGVPRAWLEQGKRIALNDVATYFGHASLTVESCLDQGFIRASVDCRSDRRPKAVEVRLPHPKGLKARLAEGGVYDPVAETVTVKRFGGRADVTLWF